MENIYFTSSLEEITEEQLQGFFVGWTKTPTPSTHLQLLENSTYFILAVDTGTKKVVGFITAITDQTLAAYIPFIEVLPTYQSKGIGKELVSKMLELLKAYYMIDLLCDTDIQKFYERFDMKKTTGMMVRNYKNQNGREN